MSGIEASATLEAGSKAGDQPQQVQPDGGADEQNTNKVKNNSAPAEAGATAVEDATPVEEKKPNTAEETTEPVENKETDTIGDGKPNVGTVEEKETAVKEDSAVTEEKKPADSDAKAEQTKTRPNRREYVKFDPSLLPESDDPEEIRKQVNISLFPLPFVLPCAQL